MVTWMTRGLRAIGLAAAMLVMVGVAKAEDRFIVLASTTSTQQSGLFDVLLPLFQRASGIAVRVVAVGTGQALQLGERGDADALLVHDRVGEEALIASGHGFDRRDVMYNDFVLIGPKADPAGIATAGDAVEALRRIAASGTPFASRGDDSGTHRMERRLWKLAGIDPVGQGRWYRELGSGMGETLNTAAAMNAYVLADRATWASFANRRDLTILVERDPRLLNPYSSILVDPRRHPAVKAADAKTWHDWLTGSAGQAAIAAYAIDGQQVFFPSAVPPGDH